jgi:pyruvate formate lyase activating enzyme
MREAYLWEPLTEGQVRCGLCNHRCRIKEGKRGLCGVRENTGGRLESLVYGKVIARNVDPIEKKPLFHVLPGSLSFSIATAGCNFRCRFCQNADISQLPGDRNGRITGRDISPEAVVADARRTGCATIAYTYTEPTIYFEFAADTAALARRQGLRNVFVTNGYMTPEALERVSPDLDAANVDLKAFSDRFYKEMCAARLAPVLETLRLMKRRGVLVEVTTLIIPGANDDPAELKDLADFLSGDLGPDTPWHISRFHPAYRLTDRPPTPVQTLRKAREIGMAAGLRYVYTGNVPGEEAESTFCHGCGKKLIDRWGFTVNANRMRNGTCPDCGVVIEGIWA